MSGMRTAARMRRAVLGMAGALTLTACVDSGLPGKNLPREEAMRVPPPYPLYERASANQPLAAGIGVAGRAWLGVAGAAAPYGLTARRELPASMLASVGQVAGASIYSLAWDEPPFDRLYGRLPTGDWRVFLPLR